MNTFFIAVGTGAAIGALIVIALYLKDIAYEMKRKNDREEQKTKKK